MNLLSTSSTAGGLGFTLIYIVVICAVMWFLLVRPQKKEQKRLDTMLASLAVGDSVVTTSGFYGVVIDLTDEACARAQRRMASMMRWRSSIL